VHNSSKRASGSIHLLEEIPLTLPETRLLHTLKLPEVRAIDEIPEPRLREDIWKAVHVGLELSQPRAVARWLSLAGEVDDVEPDLFVGRSVVGWLEGCDKVTLMVVTLGEDIYQEVDRLREGSLADAYHLDSVGRTLLDALVETVTADINHAVRKAGCEPTLRQCPGDGDWPLLVRPLLVGAVGAERIDVSCTDAHVLKPRGSVAAMIGWQSTGVSSAGRL
jgi:hypothetical protein